MASPVAISTRAQVYMYDFTTGMAAMQDYSDPNLTACAVCLALYILRSIIMLYCAVALSLGDAVSQGTSAACNLQLTIFSHIWLVRHFLHCAHPPHFQHLTAGHRSMMQDHKLAMADAGIKSTLSARGKMSRYLLSGRGLLCLKACWAPSIPLCPDSFAGVSLVSHMIAPSRTIP